ncbi:hypothetical protein ACIGBL_33555 [Streptomyces sp. NPDC085614]|uniref:hypothetical protein n=1 Tax=Streptomyces sp. NPDC085614 TaxID=3365733 RepID=UPI0037CF6865
MSPIYRGWSSYYVREGAFLIILGAGFIVLELSTSWFGFNPFGFVAILGMVTGVGFVVGGRGALCCRRCDTGLRDDRYIRFSKAGIASLAQAIERSDLDAVFAVAERYQSRSRKGITWLRVRYCPGCWQVAVLRLHGTFHTLCRRSSQITCSGPQARYLIEISELEIY